MRIIGFILLGLTFFMVQGGSVPLALHAKTGEVLKLNPQLSPEYVAMLKAQADARKAFYEDQAKAKLDLTQRQLHERQALLEQHRTARAKFTSQKHAPAERKAFFESQRKEMAELKAKQKAELKTLEAGFKKRILDFRNEQQNERTARHDRLSSSSPSCDSHAAANCGAAK